VDALGVVVDGESRVEGGAGERVESGGTSSIDRFYVGQVSSEMVSLRPRSSTMGAILIGAKLVVSSRDVKGKSFPRWHESEREGGFPRRDESEAA
jgi:hypothetical protein